LWIESVTHRFHPQKVLKVIDETLCEFSFFFSSNVDVKSSYLLVGQSSKSVLTKVSKFETFFDLFRFKFFLEFCESSSDFSHVVSGEGSEDSGSLRSSDEPSVVALLHDEDDVALLQLNLVVVLRVVVVESAVSVI